MGKGVNLLVDESEIDDEEVTYSKNMVPIQVGRMGKRGGLAFKHFMIANTRLPISYHRPTFVAPFDGVTCTRRVHGIVPENTIAWASSHQDLTAISYDFDFISGKRVCVAPFMSKMYAFPGYGGPKPGCIFQANPAAGAGYEAVDFTFQGAGNAALRPQIAVPYRQRMVYFNLGPGYGSLGVMSDDFDPTVIGDSAADARPLVVGDSDGDRIVGAVEVMLSGITNELGSGLLILREFSAYLMTGEFTQSDNVSDPFYGDVQLNRINIKSGCASPDTIVQTPYGVIWAGPDDVWLFNVGTMPIRIGWKISAALAVTPADYRYLWHASYHDGFYRLAIMSPEQDMSNPNDQPCGEQWWLDLRLGAPQDAASARWYGPQIYRSCKSRNTAPTPGTRFMAKDTRPGQPDELYGVEVTDAIVAVVFDSENTVDSALDLTEIEPVTGSLTSVADTIDNEVSTEVITKEYDLGDSEVDKLVEGVEMNLFLSQPSRIAVTAVLDGGRSVKTFNEDIGNTGYLGGVDPLDDITHLMSTEYQSVAARPLATERNIGKRIQFRIADIPGFIISDVNKYLAYQTTAGASGSGVAVLTTGFYDNLVTLLDMICTRLTAALATQGGGTFTHNQTAPPRPNLVTISAASLTGGFSSTDWGIVTTASGTVTEAQARSSRIISAFLGLDLSAAMTTPVTAIIAVPYRLSAAVGVGDIVLQMRPSRRRPI